MIKGMVVRRGQIKDEYIRMTITGKVDDILREKHPIEIKDIFSEIKGKRKVVLLEGAPGCGKSTLSVFIAQQWGEDKLFKLYKMVILVKLRDPAVQAAQCIADLLPRELEHDEQVEHIAESICKTHGLNVLFILDGWDELPQNLQKKSIFRQLIGGESIGESLLHRCAVIVTSRPISSGDLHPIVSSRIEILGFTPNELIQYFNGCLEEDTQAVKTLLERIQENPAVAGSCYLPLNASILVHLFKSDNNSLPTTQYGIFSELVLSCIYRHLNERTQYKNLSLESLCQLPDVVKKPFLFICDLAYQGVMENRVTFSSLPSTFNTLGLLQGVESFVKRGKAVSYNFLHLSIQELLAAHYMATQLPSTEQVSKFHDLFDKSHFSVVFQFYAAITKFQTPGISDVITRIVEDFCSFGCYGEENDALLISLFHCLYEVQDVSLCKFVAGHFIEAKKNSYNHDESSFFLELMIGLYPEKDYWLNIMNQITLTPSDCLCLGYFLSCVSRTTIGKFGVNLNRCMDLPELCCKYLASGLNKCLDTHSSVTTNIDLHLVENKLDGSEISKLLQTECLNMLNLTGNLIGDQGVFCIAKQLMNNTTLRSLHLRGCGITLNGAKHLATVLNTNNSLEEFDISLNKLCQDGIQYIAHALRVNHSLKTLTLMNCGLTDMELKCLALALQQNNSLQELNVNNNHRLGWLNIITERECSFVTMCLKNRCFKLELRYCPGEKCTRRYEGGIGTFCQCMLI